MLLCIGPSNQEVKTLPEMVYDWIASTHGATPEQRAQQPTALFLVLTKFDMEFEEKAGERSPEGRWTTRTARRCSIPRRCVSRPATAANSSSIAPPA